MKPLLDFRNWLTKTKDPQGKKKIRDFRRRSGKVQYWEIDGEKKIIWGPYLLNFRKEILKRLLKTQMLIQKSRAGKNVTLISTEELFKIRQIWRFEEGDWLDSLPKIYSEITNCNLEGIEDDWSGMGKTEYITLKDICEKHNLPIGLLTELFDAERRQYGMSRRSGIFNSIDAILKKDWRSREEVFSEVHIDEG